MDPTDDMIMTLDLTVKELKKGIVDYTNKSNSLPEEQKGVYYKYIKEMHQIALQITEGIKGLEKLRDLKNRLSSK